MKVSPEANKVKIDARILTQILRNDNREAFVGLFKDINLPSQEKAKLILDTINALKLRSAVKKEDSEKNGEAKVGDADKKELSASDQSTVLEFAVNHGSANIVSYIFEQVNSLDPSCIKYYLPQSFFLNPICTNDEICRKPSVKINLLLMALKTKDQSAVSALVAQLIDDIDAAGYRACIIKAFEIGDFHLLSALLNNRIFRRLEKELKPLHLLCGASKDYALLVEQFCEGLDFDLPDENGNTPLHLAVQKKHKHTVGKINHRVNLNAKNNENLKPMEVAAKVGDFHLIKLLYESGADLNSCINTVKTAIDAAKDSATEAEKQALSRLLTRLTDLLTVSNPKEASKLASDLEGEAGASVNFEDESSAQEYLYACFKGGGIKGLAYLFGIQEAIKQYLIDLDAIQGFAGTSAGSITAALLALRLPMERLEEVMKSQNFLEFFDYYDEDLVKTILAELKKGVGIWTIIRNYWLLQNTKVLLDTNLGFCKGDAFLKWIRGLIEEAIKNSPLKGKKPENITFRDLHDSGYFKDLVVYGSNVNTGMAERYSFETTPDMCIADAIRISMSIPIVFAPHKKYIFKDGLRQLAKKIIKKDGVDVEVDDEDLCVDGGLFNNYPITAFDVNKLGDYEYNEKVIGFCLVEPDEHKVFEFEESRNGSVIPEGSVIRYILSMVYSTLFNQQSFDHQKGMDRNRTIYINSQDIQTTEFGLSADRVQILAVEAVKGVVHFIARRKNMPDKTLSSEVVKKLFSLGIFLNDNGIIRLGKPKKLSAIKILKLYACAQDDELPYLKSILNPNFLENGVTPLMIARAYQYKTLEQRLLHCNANPDVPNRDIDDIKARVLVDKLIDSGDESWVMKTKKERLRIEKENSLARCDQLSANLDLMAAKLDKKKSDYSSLSQRLEKQEATSSNLVERLEERSRQQDLRIAYLLLRAQYQKTLTEKIRELKQYKNQYIALNSGILKASGREAAEKHWNCWEDRFSESIIQFFLERCPENASRTEDQIVRSYVESLRFLLDKLKDPELLKIIEHSGSEESSYRHYVGLYRKAIEVHLREMESRLVPIAASEDSFFRATQPKVESAVSPRPSRSQSVEKPTVPRVNPLLQQWDDEYMTSFGDDASTNQGVMFK